MAFQRIAQTEIDAADNLGRDDTPNAGTAGMQQILDAYPNLIAKKINLLVDSLDTEISSRYTKAETDAKIGVKVVEIGAGDMAKAVYDTNGDGVVNDSDKLGGQLPSAFASSAQGAKADSAMPTTGGIFTGNAAAYDQNRAESSLRNIEVRI
ncbi:MAG: hypothetical protein RSB78_02385, partial [Oscillospiraceae bacterium]